MNKTWIGQFTDTDLQRMRHLMSIHGQTRQAQAFRFALNRQYARTCQQATAQWVSLYEQASKIVSLRMGPGVKTSGKRCLVRFNTDEIHKLEYVQAIFHLKTMAEAMRFCLYIQATLDGFRENNEVTNDEGTVPAHP